MESSSENSFAWTDTSSDSINSATMSADNVNNHITKNDEKIMKGKKSRKKHNDESVSLEPDVVIKEEKTYFETKSNSSVKKKRIKVEPDTDNEISKKKKKHKILETNGGHNDSQESVPYDESYLNMKVKQEESSTTSSTKHKKKKKREQTPSIDLSTTPLKSHEKNSSSEIYNDNVILKDETESDIGIKKTKKKKKSKKKYDSDNQILNIEEKMDVDETIVNKNSKGKHTDSFVTDNNMLQEESEASGCDEISAIKCDDSHTTHTLSFINKTIEEEHTKINCNDNLNITSKSASIVQESSKKLQATKYRKQRISDRICYEDDDDDTNTESTHVEHESHSDNNVKPQKFKQFLKNNPNLKVLPQTYSNNNITVTRDDEIWILKCPKEINIKDFDKTTLNIHGKCKIKVGGQSYEGSAEEEQADTISLLTIDQNNYKIRNVQLSGIINLRKRIPKAHFRDDNIMVNNQTNFIPLPETKCRHPLFGSNYKKALKIPASIAERLTGQDTEEIAKRKKKKNKKEANSSEQVDSQIQSDITLKAEPEHTEVREKKKKKRKLIDDDGPAPKKVKRIKHDPESAEAWDSEKAIEENLFNF